MEAISRSDTVESCLLLEKRMDMIANNLANINTCGFKKDGISFNEVLIRAYDGRMERAKSEKVYTDFSPGDVKFTGNHLDVALVGPGFFKVETPEGIRYTRNGNFSLNNENVLVTSQGYPVVGQGGQITLDGVNIEINDDGGISLDQAGDGMMAEVNKLAIVNFDDPSALEKVGGSLYCLKGAGAAELPAEDAKLRQRYLEQSNINVMEEMVKMIQLQRSYESYQKIIQFFDEIDTRLINDVGRLT